VAVRRGHTSATKFLLEHGASETFDAFGKSPRLYASGLDRDDIVHCLDDYSKAGTIPQFLARSRTLSRKYIHVLSMAFEQAIRANNLDECQRLLAGGCPLDVRLPGCHGCSPLILALSIPRLEIAQFLLVNGASASKAACASYNFMSAIELASTSLSLASLLPTLLEKYLSEGGDLIYGKDYPLHRAGGTQNNEGLTTILTFIQENVGVLA